MTSIFLSYARGDDEPFVKRLYEDLVSRGFDVWWDRASMPARMLTFHQEIRDAINARDLLLLVVGPKAVTSDYVTQEWHFAYFVANKRINPIVRLNGVNADGSLKDGYNLIPEDLKLLHSEDFRDDAHYTNHLDNLVRQLNEPVAPVGKLVAVPELPEGYRAQPERLKALRDMLLIDLQKPVVVTGAVARVGLQGMGGIGKSVLANALAHHPEIRRAFPDGVYWVRLGQEPRIIDSQRQLAVWLGGEGTFDNITMSKEALRGLMAEKAVLLILDDVWDRPSADAFNVAGSRSRILITTRDAGLVTALAARENHYRVELPTLAESREIIAGATQKAPEDLPPEADEVINECGRLPLALVLCGGMIQGGISWKSVVEALHEHDLEFLSGEYIEEEHHRNAWKAMDVSIRVLPPEEQERFAELAVFPLDTGAPLAAVATLWQKTGGLSSRQSEALLAKFVRRSLVQHQASPEGSEDTWFVLHDLLYHFATKMAELRFGSAAALHERLLGAYLTVSPNGYQNGPNDGYYLQNLCKHLAISGKQEKLLSLLQDFAWIERKVEARIINSLIDDYNFLIIPKSTGYLANSRLVLSPEDIQGINIIQRALTLSAHVLAQKPRQLPSQLVGRLLGIENPVIINFVDRLNRFNKYPWLRPITTCLSSPGGPLMRTLTGHTNSVKAVAVTPDGWRAVSGSADNTLKVWDLENGRELATFAGHTQAVNTLAVTPDGRRAISGSSDNTLKVWGLENGRELATLTGHTGGVRAVAVTPDGHRAISGSADNTLKVWDLERSRLLATLTGHTQAVNTLAVTPDGRRAISGSLDNTLKVWDLEKNRELATLTGHTSWVSAVAVTPDGHRVISGSYDNTLKVWDLQKGWAIHTLSNRTGPVSAVAVTPDGHLAISGSFDNTLNVWDLENIRELPSLIGYTGGVDAVAVTPDGRRVVSGSWDKTLKVWDLEKNCELATLTGHTQLVSTLAVTPDGRRAISGSEDNTLKVWDLENGRELATLIGHTEGVRAVAVTPDGRRVVSGSWDKTLKVWDLEKNRELATLTGHTSDVTSVVVTPDGRRAISGSDDSTLRVWDFERGRLLATLTGHTQAVNTLAVTPDGRWTVSGSYDSLKVWDLENSRELATLTGHTKGVNAVAVTPDGRRAISGSDDDTLKVWDLENSRELATFTGHTDSIRALVVIPDGRWAVSKSSDKILKVWDLENGGVIHTLSGYSDWITALIATPDGCCIVSGSWDNNLRVWDLDSGSIIAEFCSDSPIIANCYSHECHSIVGGSQDGTISLLRLEGISQRLPIITAMENENNTLQIQCFFCQQWSDLHHENLGKEMSCPVCGKVMQVNSFTHRGICP